MCRLTAAAWQRVLVSQGVPIIHTVEYASLKRLKSIKQKRKKKTKKTLEKKEEL